MANLDNSVNLYNRNRMFLQFLVNRATTAHIQGIRMPVGGRIRQVKSYINMSPAVGAPTAIVRVAGVAHTTLTFPTSGSAADEQTVDFTRPQPLINKGDLLAIDYDENANTTEGEINITVEID